MWKKIGILIFWVILIGYLFIAVSFSSRKEEERVCKKIMIVVTDSTIHKYIHDNDIYPLVSPFQKQLIGRTLKRINTQQLERIIKAYSPAAGAEAFTTPDGTLHLEVRQRVPILRVINRFNESFFIDSEGEMMRPVENYFPLIPVANGLINQHYPKKGSLDVTRMDRYIQKDQRIIISELFHLASYLHSHPFWDAQIQQIYVCDNLDYELIPRIGNHTIILGTMDNYENKFENLEALYRKGLREKGWDTYKTINLKYQNQIVCTKRQETKNP